MSQHHQLNESFILEKYYKCDGCGVLLNMGYCPSSKPPKPWCSVEEKHNGFYLQKDYCKNCSQNKRLTA